MFRQNKNSYSKYPIHYHILLVSCLVLCNRACPLGTGTMCSFCTWAGILGSNMWVESFPILAWNVSGMAQCYLGSPTIGDCLGALWYLTWNIFNSHMGKRINFWRIMCLYESFSRIFADFKEARIWYSLTKYC